MADLPNRPPTELTHEERYSASRRADMAQRSRNNAIEERTMLLAWITRLLPKAQSHLQPIAASSASTRSLWNYVVCVHSKAGPLQWRITDFEAEAYFSHLKRTRCTFGQTTREDKMTRIANMITSVK